MSGENMKFVHFVELEEDINQRIAPKRSGSWKAANFASDFATGDPAGANDLELASIEITAGQVLEIFKIVCSSETGAKPFGIATVTAAFASPLSGVAGYTLYWAALITATQVITDSNGDAFLVIDNSAGSSTLYCHLYGITGFMDTVQANTEDLAAYMAGYLYTP